jgi:hypothetical protein
VVVAAWQQAQQSIRQQALLLGSQTLQQGLKMPQQGQKQLAQLGVQLSKQLQLPKHVSSQLLLLLLLLLLPPPCMQLGRQARRRTVWQLRYLPCKRCKAARC